MTRERESIDVFHKQPRSEIQCTCQHYQLPRLVAKPSQQTSHALPEPDFTQEKNPTPSLTPNLAISCFTQQERQVNKSVPPFHAMEAWMWLITKQKYYNNLPPWVKLSHSLDLWPSRNHQRWLLVSLDSMGDSST